MNSNAPPPGLQAILSVTDQGVAHVCAWCKDKPEADAWCSAQGITPSHSICPGCQSRVFDQMNNLQKEA